MDLDIDRSFTAHGEMFDGTEWTPATIQGRFPSLDHEPVQLSVAPSNQWSGSILNRAGPAKLRGTTTEGTAFLVPGFLVDAFTHNTSTRRTYVGNAKLFIDGHLDEFSDNGEVTLKVSVTPIPIAQAIIRKLWRIDGTILPDTPGMNAIAQRHEAGEPIASIPADALFVERKGIRWATPIGEAELVDQYFTADVSNINGRQTFTRLVGVNPAMTQLQQYQITIKSPQSGAMSFATLLSELPTMLAEPLELLSFLGHRTVRWYSAEARFRPTSGNFRQFRRANARHCDAIYEPNAIAYPVLIREERLKQGLFQEMLVRFRALPVPLQQAIRQAIRFFLASHEYTKNYDEARLVGLYSALEALVDARNKVEGKEFILGSNQFKRLTKVLRQQIRAEVTDQDVADQIIGKLSELRRPAYIGRLRTLLADDGVDLTKIWPGTGVEQQLRWAMARRHVLIHQGKVLDRTNVADWPYFDDLPKLQRLVELWVLRILRCTDADLNY